MDSTKPEGGDTERPALASRRSALKKIAAGGALIWSAPAIASLNVAYAQANGESPPGGVCDQIVFSDGFEDATCGLTQTLPNWTIVAGTIDVIGQGCPQPFVNAPTKVVDLDGTDPCANAIIDTNTTFAAGSYQVSFDLGGSQRGDTNSVRVQFGSLNEVIALPSNAPMTTYTRAAVLAAPAKLRFDHTVTGGANCIGLLLDNVEVKSCV